MDTSCTLAFCILNRRLFESLKILILGCCRELFCGAVGVYEAVDEVAVRIDFVTGVIDGRNMIQIPLDDLRIKRLGHQLPLVLQGLF